ncbi:MAG: GldG family protein [Deltaproteobacteria bacterium]|nr:GldG family protein [Deltaproteobacteria bacterium]
MTNRKRTDLTVFTLAVLGSLVALNIIGIKLFGRLDLTHDREFTLSRATKSVLRDLKDPVTVRAYFTKDLPPPFSSNARYVRDLLEEYYSAGHGNFRYEFINPEAEETDADKEKKKEVKTDIFGRAVREATSIERELQTVGIQPMQVQVNEGDKLEVKRAYMGLAIKHGDKTEAIPVVRSTAGLEYDLTTMVRKMTRERTPKVVLLSSLEGAEMQQAYGRMLAVLNEMYQVSPLPLQTTSEIPTDADALVVLGVRDPVLEPLKKSIDAFITSGRSVAFLLDAAKVDLQTAQAEPIEHGLAEMLTSYGVTIGEGLVLDAACATLNVTQQRGFMRISQPVKYPFMPLPESLDPDHPLTRGLSQVAFPFTSPLTVGAPADGAVKAEVLVRSSAESFVHKAPYNLDPFQRWTSEGLSDKGAKPMVVTLTGPIKSFFGGGSQPEAGESKEPEGANARVLVAGGSMFVSDQFMAKGSEALLLNLLDWMVLDEELLAVRSRGLAAAPLDELSDAKRNTLKYANIVGVPLAFIAFGLMRWRMRENRRSKVTL